MSFSVIHRPQLLPSIKTPSIKTHYHYKYHSTITLEQHLNNNIEIRVCTNKTCRRQGSMATLDTLLAIAPPHISVSPCGCLGHCGSGPNLVVLPQAAMASHCGTPTCAAQVMAYVCGDPDPDGNVRQNLDALALRKRAEVEFEAGHLSNAKALFSQIQAGSARNQPILGFLGMHQRVGAESCYLEMCKAIQRKQKTKQDARALDRESPRLDRPLLSLEAFDRAPCYCSIDL